MRSTHHARLASGILGLLAAGLSGWACGDAGSDSGDATASGQAAGDLVAPNKWRELTADEDPLAEERPETVDCPAGAWGEEDGVFEVETDLCNYGAFGQDSAVGVAVGDEVVVSLYHLELWAEEEAEAHIAVGLGDTLLVDLHVPVPSDAETYELRTTMQQDAPAGTPAWFHVHNHGYNAYRLVRVYVAED